MTNRCVLLLLEQMEKELRPTLGQHLKALAKKCFVGCLCL